MGFAFASGQRPQPNKQGRVATTMEWARKLSDSDVKVLCGEAPYSEKLPNVDEGFTQADVNDARRAQAVIKVIQARLAKAQQDKSFAAKLTSSVRRVLTLKQDHDLVSCG